MQWCSLWRGLHFVGDGELSRFLVTDLVQFTADNEVQFVDLFVQRVDDSCVCQQNQQVSGDGVAQFSAAESLVSAVKALQVRKQV